MEKTDEFWRQAEAIFHETVDLAEPTRTSVLETRCAGDTTLMAELRSLLQACEAEQTHQDRATSDNSIGIPLERVGPYALDRLLGRGGMGAVYLAHRADGHFSQQVAIKLIDLPLATNLFRERFRAERQILAGLVHPYIARLLDGGVTDGGELYLAMEYIEGVSITQFCDTHKLDTNARLALFRKVCDAVQFAHQNLVVHRDLKPDNILVDAEGTPRLLDFGTAKILTPASGDSALNLTQPGLQTFTPRYASPEQVLGRPITTASDTYSLGILLHVLLTGNYPYELSDFSTEEMVHVICEQPPIRPSAFVPGIDTDLDSIVSKALRKEPQERYVIVEQLSTDVQAYLDGRPIEARRGNVRYLTSKFVRRNKLAIFAASLLVITVIAGVGGVLWQSHIANQQRHRAEGRSADLRELSISLLSELDDALRQIPGSTGAQQLLITRVLEHLDRMAKDSDGDRQTQLALVDAYTRLGNVQGNIYYQNVADTAGAVASFNRALALAEPMAKQYPKDREVLRAEAAALEARGETLSDSGDAQASVNSLHAAVDVYDRLIQLPGATAANMFEAAIANETLGNELGEDTGMGDAAAAAISYHRTLSLDARALQINPGYAAVRRGIPLMHIHLGNLVLETDPMSALAEFQLAAVQQSALPAAQHQLLSQRRLQAMILRKQAATYVELGQYAMAANLFQQAQQQFQALLDADKKNTAALADMRRLAANESAMYEYAADPRLAEVPADRRKNLLAALATLQQYATYIREVDAQTPSHGTANPELAGVVIHIDNIRRALGMSTDAAATSAAVETLRKGAESPHATASDIDLAVNAILSTGPASKADLASAVGWAEHGVRLTHNRSPNYYLLLALAHRANHQPDLATAAARKGIELLGHAATSQPGFRLQKLLNLEAARPVAVS